MRSIVLFLIGLLLGACAAPKATSQPAADTHASHSPTASAADLAAKTVALVHRPGAGAPHPYCTGVWMSDAVILTAHHCVDDLDPGERVDFAMREDIFAPGSLEEAAHAVTRSASVLALDPDHDLALLRSGVVPSHPIARLSQATILQGHAVQTMGHPRGMWWSFSSGDVAAVRKEEISGHNIVWIQSTAPISAGNSGGGLFDADGYLLGVAHAQNPNGQNLNLYVHGQYVDALLRRVGR